MADGLFNLTLHEARELLESRQVSSQELTQAALGRIEEVDSRVSAFVTVTGEAALDQARQADEAIAQGRGAPLTGIPMQVKDNMCTRGVPTTCSSRMLESFVPPYNATVVERLQAQRAVVVGKGNMDEFAMGSSTENSAFFPTRNPWDLERVPGLVLNAIAGHDPKDSTSIPRQAPDYTASLKADIKGMRVGVPKEYYGEGIDGEVTDTLRKALAQLEELGATVEETSLPHTMYALAVYYILAPSEASANLARYDGVKYGYSSQDAGSMWEAMEQTKQHGFGPEVKRRIMLGTYALSAGYYDAYYLKAQKVRTLISREFQEAFQKYDILVTPVSPTVAFKLGEKVEDPVQMYLSDICTIPVNIAGIPAMSVPAGFVDGLPVGMQIMGRPLGEETILRAAYAYEQATEWHKMRPAL